jgi:hypothetical protein
MRTRFYNQTSFVLDPMDGVSEASSPPLSFTREVFSVIARENFSCSCFNSAASEASNSFLSVAMYACNSFTANSVSVLALYLNPIKKFTHVFLSSSVIDSSQNQ